MSRRGKIARLPRAVREQLNRRLEEGELCAEVLAWLNELPECKAVLSEKFGGRPINQQNLSDWKLGGYEEWLRHEETRERVELLMEQGDDFDDTAGANELADRLGSVVAAELAEAVLDLGRIEDRKERWQRLQEISRELSRLRRGDYQGKRFEWEKQFQKSRLKVEQAESRKKAPGSGFGEDVKSFLLAARSLGMGGVGAGGIAKK